MRHASPQGRDDLRIPSAVALTTILALAGWWSGSAFGTPERPETVTLEAIRARWAARENSIRTASVVWRLKYTQPKGSVSVAMPRVIRTRLKMPEGKVVPPRDIVHELRSTLAIDGSKARYTCQGTSWSVIEDKVVPYTRLSTFDGATSKLLNPDGHGQRYHWPQGVVYQEPYFVESGKSELRPVLDTVRPVNAHFRPWGLDSFRVTGRRGRINKVACVELERPETHAHGKMVLWLDPARDYVVVRQVTFTNAKVLYQADIRYGKQDKVWMPAGWESVLRNADGLTSQATEATVIACAINTNLEPSLFSLIFPNGTSVRDEKRGQRYVIKPDGSKRTVTRADAGATYEQVIASGPGPRASFIHSWIGGCVTVAGLLALGCYLWRLRMRLSRGSQSGN